MTSLPVRLCARCVMDTTDPCITFDDHGVCHYCRRYEQWDRTRPSLSHRSQALATLVQKIRRESKGRDYDCLIGLSGGIDSSFLAFKVVELGLRPLVMHFDSGWNSESSVHNIEQIVKRLGLDLFTVVCDWEEMRDLQRAFLLAAQVNCDIPQDHAFIAALLEIASRQGIRHIISGHNMATESIMSPAWRGHDSRDWKHIRGIHERYGTRPLLRYPHFNYWKYSIHYPIMRRIKFHPLLELMDYNKQSARSFLESEIGWKDYGGKHRESRFTSFFQGIYLLEKFGYDKRKAHLASLIVSGQMDRAEALVALQVPPFPSSSRGEEIAFILKKLGLTEEQWTQIKAKPPEPESGFPSEMPLYRLHGRVRGWLGKVKRALLP